MPFWVFNKSRFKTRVAREANLRPENLLYHPEIVRLARERHAAGCPVCLVTGTSEHIARAVAGHLNFFDTVVAVTEDGPDMTGKLKRDELVRRFGARGFDYAGNSRQDLPVWEAAGEIIVAEPTAAVRRALASGRLKADRVFAERRRPALDVLRALRPHQWLKNVLVFAPVLASHRFEDAGRLFSSTLAFCSFSLAASAVYVLNDLLDLDSDRKHPVKCQRPFAAGRISLLTGIALAPVLAAAALTVGLLAGPALALFAAAYLLAVLLYSLRLKRIAIADVILLSGLYTLRVYAGSAASSIPVSPWLAALCMFLFLSLAMAKRHSELVSSPGAAAESGEVPGRGYRPGDAAVVQSLGTSSGYISALVLALYVQSDMGRSLYAHPDWLWLLVPILCFWVGRLWLMSARGELDADPVVFALRDKTGWLLAGLCAVIVVLAGAR